MPYTGYDPYGPQDWSGGGLDPSLYYALSPGGRFPGDTQNFLEYLAAQSRGTAGGNPDYDVPDWLTKMGKAGRLLGAHERNVQQGGEGQAPSDVGGYPFQWWSGPGASYGPPGGPLHGLIDQGRPTDPWDGADRPPGGSVGGGGGGKGGGKGGPKFEFNFTPYAGMQHQSSFVDWQPTQAFSGSSGPTRFVPGQGSTSRPPVSAIPPLGAGGKGGPVVPGIGGGGKGKGGKGGGKGTGKGGGKNGGKTTPPLGAQGGSSNPSLDFLEWLVSSRGTENRWGAAPGPGLRQNILGGVDPNNIDKGTPGWMQDPTTGIADTRGMPNATPFGPNQHGSPNVGPPGPGESFDSYLTRLHDSGLDAEAIGGLVGPYGLHQNEAGQWEQGWGTGPVLRGPGGYQFANQGGLGLGTDRSADRGGSNAADAISGGVFSVPLY